MKKKASSEPPRTGGPSQRNLCCPVCRASVEPAAKTFPFCSKRCRLVDLGQWLDGKYRIEEGTEEQRHEGTKDAS